MPASATPSQPSDRCRRRLRIVASDDFAASLCCAGSRSGIPGSVVGNQESGVRSADAVGGHSSLIAQHSSFASSLRMLLAHEWAHIRRGDLWLLAASRLLLVVLFAHPLYWLLRRRLRFDQELMADAEAAAICGRQEYAETLFAWARHLPARRFSPAGALGMCGTAPANYQGGSRCCSTNGFVCKVLARDFGNPELVYSSYRRLCAFVWTRSPGAGRSRGAPTDVPAKQRAKLPITHDTPADQVVARVGSETILVGDIKAFMWQTIEEKTAPRKSNPTSSSKPMNERRGPSSSDWSKSS